MASIKLVQGDTRPTLTVDLIDRVTWAPVDVSAAGASVVMKFRAVGSSTVLFTLTATKQTGQLLPDGTVDTTVTPAGKGGRVLFTWTTGSLDNLLGYYEGEVSVNFADGSVQTIYDRLRFYVREDM